MFKIIHNFKVFGLQFKVYSLDIATSVMLRMFSKLGKAPIKSDSSIKNLPFSLDESSFLL